MKKNLIDTDVILDFFLTENRFQTMRQRYSAFVNKAGYTDL